MNIVILAAGIGKRMHSERPKVLHLLAGRPVLSHVISTARALATNRLIVVVGHGAEAVREAIAAPDIKFVLQAEQQGTGHAVQQALPFIDPSLPTLVLYGDVPLTRASTLRRLVKAAANGHYGVLTVTLDDPCGYGRIVRDCDGRIIRIIEQKDANPWQRQICEINTGIVISPSGRLEAWLSSLKNDNMQHEFYLTDVVERAINDGVEVVGVQPDDIWEALGVNNKRQLADLERVYQRNEALRLLDSGVTLVDPSRIDVRGTLECGAEVLIDVNCVFEGHVVLGDYVNIEPNCVIRETTIAAGTRVNAFTYIDGACLGENVVLGPYARLRSGTILSSNAHVGNFVEIKNAVLGHYAKANHLSYIGDADIGARVNIGAGTITCNYDGVNKHRTVVCDDVFIGSDTQLVAPVIVGSGATLAAGTTVWHDVPAGALALNEKTQIAKTEYARPVKKKA
ncbi:bifunctional UDP-N-acetylglucosamine diphosphorylase/glucosamine-1-phosphate N-acetyltransferase GlmU [Candidatus Vallotiella sp. (ex Adelges kitamiensis)]|uniref:bifunctional UDP-N-acetylglucosamine diphosphorylase/glucosamine-1-phosphate N-acetyltransferase GlmU n=1 Tax=Candidatus Vallotiella sp. (ex Adelges kitamiensis) TaxID=2864217 RepID=UPI001CE37750|nr:bifunctional UDP-N-acetylglucosamine diphosphorylase/glucosamine-1-phosphate N-acetyltransferase GlmU [Candidatus Vallotia sp. (ex Adelges kitamiensis)]